MTTILAQLEVSMQIICKGENRFFALAWDIDTMNLVFEVETLTRQGASAALANWLVGTLDTATKHA